MSDAVFERMLFEFQDGLTPPHVWLRYLAKVPGLEDFVVEWQREHRSLPERPMTAHEAQFWKPQDPPRAKLTRAEHSEAVPPPAKRGKVKRQVEMEF